MKKPRIAPSAVVWLVLGGAYFLTPLVATLLFSLKDAQTGKCCSLSAYGEIWAAAGHPNTVFPLTYAELVRITGGTEADLAQSS